MKIWPRNRLTKWPKSMRTRRSCAAANARRGLMRVFITASNVRIWPRNRSWKTKSDHGATDPLQRPDMRTQGSVSQTKVKGRGTKVRCAIISFQLVETTLFFPSRLCAFSNGVSQSYNIMHIQSLTQLTEYLSSSLVSNCSERVHTFYFWESLASKMKST